MQTPSDSPNADREAASRSSVSMGGWQADARIAELETRVAELQRKLADAETRVQSSTNAQSIIEQLSADLAAVHASASWRITAPLRACVHATRRAVHAAESLTAHLRARGGVINALRHYYAIWHKEGMQGVRRRATRILARDTFETVPKRMPAGSHSTTPLTTLNAPRCGPLSRDLRAAR
ncbi:ABC transporter C-terminal domain-containing protein [Pseudomonas citronellolis]|uniref:ABC transporter C-terminal domain-containing protein n=1 Tax=Pseudomonas citronellolis TaxID=53408 RepID=UPI00192CF440|nr:ABC transporter C-terminal domain-containing protein [Pseudomonas humi]